MFFNSAFYFASGILLDELVYKHYSEHLENTVSHLYVRKNAIKNSDTSYGVLFPYARTFNTTNAKWASYLRGFFKDNEDNLDVIVELAMRDLPRQVRCFTILEFAHYPLVAILCR